MIEQLITQYGLVQKSRITMLNFIEDVVKNDLTTPVSACQNKDIGQLLIHNAECYLYWLLHMALEHTVEWPKDSDFKSIADVFKLYKKVDAAMERFLNKYKEHVNSFIDNSRMRADKLSASAAMIFTHVITHEFHHKGQIMSMCRQLGHLPPETDIYNFFLIEEQ